MGEMPENEQELADMKKLLFMNTQVSIAKSILSNLLAQDAAWDNCDFFSEPTVEQKKTRIDHYQTACKLLYSMQLAFGEAAAIDSSLFGPVWQKSVDVLKAYPKTCLGVIGTAGLAGALTGAGYVNLYIGFKAFLTATFGKATLATGAFVGGLAGVVATGALIAIITLYQRWSMSKEEADVEELLAMKARISKIAQQELSQKDLLELDDLFRKAFHQPMTLARNEHCPICLEHFRADGGNTAEYAVKAPGCTGNHLVHQKCLLSWCLSSCDANAACVICRQ